MESTRDTAFVQFGCGYSAATGWRNFDASPTARIERLPLVGGLLGRLSGNAARFPDAVEYGDVVRGLPVAAGSVRGLYASHVLEHLSRADLRRALEECHRVLAPGGVFRLIVPDLLSRARAYVARSERGDASASHDFMAGSYLGLHDRPRGMKARARAMFGNTAHLWMWDEASMTAELREAGFTGIRRATFNDAAEPMFARVEEAGRFVDGEHVEVALEALRPG